MNPAPNDNKLQPPIPTSQVQNDESLEFSKEFFYSKGADTSVRLKEGKILKFNKGSLISCSGSKILYQVFCGELRDEEITDIPDCNYKSFKLFLDCCMGYEEFTFDTSYDIFPIVWKYQVDKMISKCIEALKPNVVTPKVLELYRMARQCCCETLIIQTRHYLNKNINIDKYFEDYGYNFKQEGTHLISKVSWDSYVMQKILDEARIQLEKEANLNLTMTSYLEKYDVLKFFKLEHFETTQAISKFCRSENGKNIFSMDEILFHIENSKSLKLGKSEWMVFRKTPSTLTEEIVIPSLTIHHSNYSGLQVLLKTNKVVFYETKTFRPGERSNTKISCEIEFIGEDEFGDEIFRYPKIRQYNSLSSDFSFDFETCFDERLARCFLEIKWTFFCECRVLLMNRQHDELNDPEKMFFVRDCTTKFTDDDLEDNI